MRDPTPAYYRIFQTLRQRIAAGEIGCGAQLPTEEELVQEFAVSRHTIRAAVQHLADQGLVRKQAGKGTFVLNQALDSDRWAAQSLDDIVDYNLGHMIADPARNAVEAGSAEDAEARRHLAVDGPIDRFTWARHIGAGPSTHATVYLPRALAETLPSDWASRLKSARLLHLLEQSAGVEAFRVRQRSSAAAADAAAAAALDVAAGAPLLVLHRTYFERSGRILEHSRILVRPDRHEPVVDLFRVRRPG